MQHEPRFNSIFKTLLMSNLIDETLKKILIEILKLYKKHSWTQFEFYINVVIKSKLKAYNWAKRETLHIFFPTKWFRKFQSMLTKFYQINQHFLADLLQIKTKEC